VLRKLCEEVRFCGSRNVAVKNMLLGVGGGVAKLRKLTNKTSRAFSGI
jgi:hypothetical protein